MSKSFAFWVMIGLMAGAHPGFSQTNSPAGTDAKSTERDDFADSSEERTESGDVEALYDKYDQDQTKKQEVKKQTERKKEELKEATTLSELANLAPFTDVAVIQRRFLPRSGRFEFSGSGMTSLNNPFFNNLGLAFRGAYYFVEKHALEVDYMMFSNTRRDVTVNLEDQRKVSTANLVSPKSYMGASYKFTPFYGKITFLNRHIVPFDFFFNAGLGLTKTDKQNEPTIFLGTGQSFALSKSLAVRWDLVWNFYSAETDSVTSSGTSTTNHNDMFLSVGASFFIPEATYR